MAVIDTINVGGADYSVQDSVARTGATNAMIKVEALEINEGRNRQAPASFFGNNCENRADNTYYEAHAAYSPFYWNSFNSSTTGASWFSAGMLMRTTKAVTAGTQIIPGTNCEAYPLSNYMDKIKTYVGSDGKLHFTNTWGADSALNFSGGGDFNPSNSIYLDADGSGKTIVINNVNKAVIIHYSFGTDSHGAMKIYWKEGATMRIRSQDGDYSHLGYSGLTDSGVTLTFNPWGYPFHACQIYPWS